MSRLYDKLQQADKEKLVEEAYHIELQEALKYNGNRVISLQIENNTDGILETEYYADGKAHIFKIIIESKYEESFNLSIARAKVLLQVVCYLKKQEDLGKTPPNIVFIGDRNECFTVHTRYLQKYIQMNILGLNSPSTAFQKNPLILKEMSDDKELQEQCYVYEVDKDFSLVEVVEKMLSLVQNIKLIVPITERSISKIFEYFSMRILKRDSKGETKYTPRMQVELFMELLLNPNECILHTKKKDIAIMENNQVSVNSDSFRSFTNFYEFNYSLEEQKSFTSICDRLIEDTDRRRKGDFYTPVLWVDEAHKMLSENIGEDWKEEYIVWDCAAGTKNLTRDYDFKRLYSSTLESHDLVISSKYNKQAGANWAFQYDFLNDDVELFEELRIKKELGIELTVNDFENSKLYIKAPGLIRGMLSGQKVLFFINPPYGTANEYGEGSKSGMALTKINKLMIDNNIGGASQQLYAQFMYRITEIQKLFNSNIRLAQFTKLTFVSGPSYKKFRESFYSDFMYRDGMIFQASQFADVSGDWGVVFTIWEEGLTENQVIDLRVKEFTTGSGIIVQIGIKKVYSSDNNKASSWVKKPIKDLELTNDVLPLNGALKLKGSQTKGALVKKGSLGYMHNNANSVMYNNQYIGLYSTSFSAGHGVALSKENIDRAIGLFTARKLITGKYSSWVNDKDEYLIPNTENIEYNQYINDSLIVSLFSTASNQSSLRGIDYNGKEWDIYNQFFFMSKEEIMDLAQGIVDRSTINNNVEDDINEHGKEERFIYDKLQEITLSPDAQVVLDKAIELVVKSFSLRDMFNQEHPEYHIETWDAGWYQIKGLLKEYNSEDLKDFNKLYKDFEDRMRPLVYTLGFLKE